MPPFEDFVNLELPFRMGVQAEPTAGNYLRFLGFATDGRFVEQISSTDLASDIEADLTGLLRADGTVALTANWDAGGFEIRAQTFESDVATGTAPLVVASTTKVTNLNCDLLDGLTSAQFAQSWYSVIEDNDLNTESADQAFTKLTLFGVSTGGIRTEVEHAAGNTTCNFRLAIDTLTAETVVDGAADYIAYWDASGTGNKDRKLLIDNLPFNNYSHPNHTGDVTSVGDGATTISNDAVTTVKILDDNVTGAKIEHDITMPGNIGMVIPTGTNAQETGTTNGAIRYDSDDNKFRARENGSWVDMIGAGGGGDVSGPGSSTDNAIATWDGTGGDTLQDSNFRISGNQLLNGNGNWTLDTVSGTDRTIGILNSSSGDVTLSVSGTLLMGSGENIQTDNIRESTLNADIDISISGTGNVVLDGGIWPTDSTTTGGTKILQNNGSGTLSWQAFSIVHDTIDNDYGAEVVTSAWEFACDSSNYLELSHAGGGNNDFPEIRFTRSAAVENNDDIGYISFYGNNTSVEAETASIFVEAEGDFSVSDLRSIMVFSCTNDGAAAPTVQLRLGGGTESQARFGQLTDNNININTGNTTTAVISPDDDIAISTTYDGIGIKLQNASAHLDAKIQHCCDFHDFKDRTCSVGCTVNVGGTLKAETITGDFLFSPMTNSNTASDEPSQQIQRSRGTEASPTAVQSGDDLGLIEYMPYHSGGAYRTAYSIGVDATENHTGSVGGVEVVHSWIPTGAGSLVEGFKLTSSGGTNFFQVASGVKIGFGGTTRQIYGSGDDLYLDPGSGNEIRLQVNLSDEVSIKADEMVLNAGATDVGFKWDSSGLLKMMIGTSEEATLEADEFYFYQTALIDVGFRWPTTAQIDIVAWSLGSPIQIATFSTSQINLKENTDITGWCDASGGFRDNGTAGVDGTFRDRNNNTVTVSGGIITSLS